MTRAIVYAVVVTLLLGAGAILWFRSRHIRRRRGIGFREWVKYPFLRSLVAESSDYDDVAVKRLAKRSPKKLVAMLLDDERHDLAEQAIELVGPSMVPALIDALSQPEFRRKSDPEQEDSEPLIRVLECLEAYAPQEALPALAHLAEEDDDEIREHAALLLGTIGTDPAIEPLIHVLSDDDEYVRISAIQGILRALEEQRVSEDFRTRVFEAVQPLVFQDEESADDQIPACLLELDRDRAISFLTAPDSLTAGREGLKDVLESLREADVSVEEDVLLKIVHALENKADDYPNEYVLGETLRLLARIDSESARDAIARGTESKSKKVREDAMEALAAIGGLDDPFGVAFDRLDSVGWSGLTEAQRHVLAVRLLIDQVNNGGFAQYFVNHYGDHWREARAGLEAIEATSDLAQLQEAVAMFGPDGPSTDRDERHRELARLVKDNDGVFYPIEEEFFKDEQSREVLLLRYIISHSADFSGA